MVPQTEGEGFIPTLQLAKDCDLGFRLDKVARNPSIARRIKILAILGIDPLMANPVYGSIQEEMNHWNEKEPEQDRRGVLCDPF